MINLGTSTMQDFALGDNLVERIDLGDTTIFDPYTTLTGTLPLSFNSRVAGALKNYRIHGTSAGAGVETENLFAPEDVSFTISNVNFVFENGQITVIGTSTGNISSVNAKFKSNTFRLTAGTYYYKAFSTPVSVSLALYEIDGTATKAIVSVSDALEKSFVLEQDADVFWGAYIPANITINGTVLISITPGSTAPTSYIPYGYKIPILNTSGVTENLVPEIRTANGWRPGYLSRNDGTYNSSQYRGEWLSPFIDVESMTSVSIVYKSLPSDASPSQTIYFFDTNDEYLSSQISLNNGGGTFNDFPSGTAKICYAFRTYCNTEQDLIQAEMWTMLVKGSAAPDHYIPHRYESNYDLFIGSTKLGAEEYVDYGEQKVYKDVSGTLTPTDPPAPLPPIPTYKDENTLSSTETLGEVTVKGRISAISP